MASANRRLSTLATVAVCVVFQVSSASAGPWVPAEGESYTQASFGVLHATDRDEYLLNLYGEFGVFDRLAVIVGIPIKYLDRTAPSPTGDP